MKTVITYKNDLGQAIKEDEIVRLDSYEKVYTVNDAHKKSEIIEKGTVALVFYNLEKNEKLEDVLSLYPSVRISIMIDKHCFKQYEILSFVSYKDSKLLWKTIDVVYGSHTICKQEIDLETNLGIVESTRKFYYFSDETFYEFSYNENGNVLGMYSINDKNSGDWKASELDSLGGFSWIEVGDYYNNAEPILPVS